MSVAKTKKRGRKTVEKESTRMRRCNDNVEVCKGERVSLHKFPGSREGKSVTRNLYEKSVTIGRLLLRSRRTALPELPSLNASGKLIWCVDRVTHSTIASLIRREVTLNLFSFILLSAEPVTSTGNGATCKNRDSRCAHILLELADTKAKTNKRRCSLTNHMILHTFINDDDDPLSCYLTQITLRYAAMCKKKKRESCSSQNDIDRSCQH